MMKRVMLFLLVSIVSIAAVYYGHDYYAKQQRYSAVKTEMLSSLEEFDGHLVTVTKVSFEERTISEERKDEVYESLSNQFIAVSRLYNLTQDRNDQSLQAKANNLRLAILSVLGEIKHYDSSVAVYEDFIVNMDKVSEESLVLQETLSNQ